MKILLALARAIDKLNEYAGRTVRWLVLITVCIAAGNAVALWLLSDSSNAWIEVQWYLFGAVFLLAAGDTLRHNGHVRVDVLYSCLPPRARAWIDIVGSALFLLPLCGLIIWLSWPGFVESFVSGERSPDAGGLLRWPVRLLIPLGFALLALQGGAELIKRIAFLRGLAPLPHERPVEQV
ncbi:MAG: C4-dicarboxylate ABC transporter [Acidithiobacillales bacterium SM1_46]|jgi:TRAP-type mannitol/chloroaromatic compound transport system permease small subunit|nr:MAG: C4-dicarboxylate ABC transporter [Acidithiobacillales bacterium SM1_46]